MSFSSSIPARLHVLLAQEAPYGVVIRRGPSKQVCTIGWNREDDSFTVGQWLKGRIFERRSDLSPDGKHLIYFAINGHWDGEAKGSWTALSRAPYLKALGLWPKGDTWFGGGLFVDKKKYWLNGSSRHDPLAIPSGLKRVAEYPNYVFYSGECPGVYYLRLQRDGWTRNHQLKREKKRGDGLHAFEKRINEQWILRKWAYETIDSPDGKGCYYDEHELENIQTGEKISHPDWEWADVDRDRLVWAENGKLMAGRMGTEKMNRVKELYDFNGMEFEPIKAPY